MTEEKQRVVARESCPKCDSRDNLARYEDGHAFCFGQNCGYYEPPTTDASDIVSQKREIKNAGDLISGSFPENGLPKRRLEADTCRKFGYGIGEFNGQEVQIANYRNTAGQVYLQKLKFADKRFVQLGDTKEPGLFGQHLWRAGPSNTTKFKSRLVITEGEIDAMSMSQAMGNKWPVVSIRNGATGAKRDIEKVIDWVTAFDEVVLMFDNDKPGRDAAREVASIMPPGKVRIAELPLKDANEMLKAGRSRELVSACWEARPFRPDGVVSSEDILDSVIDHEDERGIPWPFEGLNDKLFGLRTSEITTVAMGSGVGKSTLVRQIAYQLHMGGYQVGMLMLEETVKRTAKQILGLHMRRRLHLNPASPAEMREAWHDMFKNGRQIVFYDHFGSTEIENLLSRIRYMAQAMKCKFIILDHLSIAVSGLDVGDERKELDMGMTKLRQLVQELDIGLVLVVHLKRPGGEKGFSQVGMRPRAHHIRGTQGIEQMSDNIIMGGRGENDTTLCWVDKNRLFSEVHHDDETPVTLQFDKITGWFNEIEGESEYNDETEGEDAEGQAPGTRF